MDRYLLVLLSLAGCRQAFGLEAPTREIDAAATAADAPFDTAATEVCVGSGLVTICYTPDTVPEQIVQLADDVDTTTGGVCTRELSQPSGPELCLVEAKRATITAALRVVGARPLVLVAVDGIAIDGTVDVSSTITSGGAGANTGTCMAAQLGSNALATSPAAGAGGGGGGGFGTSGGPGGPGDTAQGGNPGGAVALTAVRGGCAGARGGSSSVGIGGLGGAGGGAVYLAAGTSILVRGTINASGAGGRGGPDKAGGGGGGSGGLIVLDAPTVNIAVSARIFANGGGGGEGGGGGAPGDNGGVSTAPNTAASGGADNSNGGNGGEGAVGASMGGPGGIVGVGGGGGGGGGGRIQLFASTVSNMGQVSPPASGP